MKTYKVELIKDIDEDLREGRILKGVTISGGYYVWSNKTHTHMFLKKNARLIIPRKRKP